VLNKGNSVLITGVSSGIGFDAARYLVEKGYFVFGSVRDAQAAEPSPGSTVREPHRRANSSDCSTP